MQQIRLAEVAQVAMNPGGAVPAKARISGAKTPKVAEVAQVAHVLGAPLSASRLASPACMAARPDSR